MSKGVMNEEICNSHGYYIEVLENTVVLMLFCFSANDTIYAETLESFEETIKCPKNGFLNVYFITKCSKCPFTQYTHVICK